VESALGESLGVESYGYWVAAFAVVRAGCVAGLWRGVKGSPSNAEYDGDYDDKNNASHPAILFHLRSVNSEKNYAYLPSSYQSRADFEV